MPTTQCHLCPSTDDVHGQLCHAHRAVLAASCDAARWARCAAYDAAEAKAAAPSR